MGWRSWNLFEMDVSQALLDAQVDGLTRNRHGKSLRDLGYTTIGLDDGWQVCHDGGYHDKDGQPMVNLTRFPDMLAMTNYARSKNVSMGWYGNNCGCHGDGDKDRYVEDAVATVKFGFDATKIDSCGVLTNITAWRQALDKASAEFGGGRHIVLENCRNYDFTQNLTSTTECSFDLFRTTEDNAPDFISIMYNLVMNAKKPGAPTDEKPHGEVHGGLPVSHPGCWSYPDMLETIGSGKCSQTLAPGTCGRASPVRRAGGLDLNESRAHFGAWCVVSSPLTLGHDLSNDQQYDAAWPVISNEDAIRVDQTWAGDAGRLMALSPKDQYLVDIEHYNGAACECASTGSMPGWAVFAKRLTETPATEAAAIAINFGNSTLPAGTISVSMSDIFGDATPSALASAVRERDVWAGADARVLTRRTWDVPELAPRSSYFVILRRESSEYI